VLNFYTRRLNTFMLLGLVLGGLIGFLLPGQALNLGFIGELFIRLLSLFIVPVIFISILSGVLQLDSSGNLARVGIKTFLYYMITTGLAVILGLGLVNIVQPGKTAGTEQALVSYDQEIAVQGGLGDVIRNIIPNNIIEAASEGNVLGIIFFSLFLGVALLQLQHTAFPNIRDSVAGVFQALIWMIEKSLLLAPIGFLALMADLVGTFVIEKRLEELGGALLSYTGCVVAGLLIHGLVVLPLIAYIFRINSFRLFKKVGPALATAFSTASSTATLPVTIDCLTNRAKISKATAGFVAPLGSTVNMDGTAIYEAVAVIFIANMVGVELDFTQQFVVFLTATFSAIGAAGIPGAGLIMMVLILNAVGLPPEAISLVVVVDRALDMMRTCLNVWGDSIGSAVVAASEGEELPLITLSRKAVGVSAGA